MRRICQAPLAAVLVACSGGSTCTIDSPCAEDGIYPGPCVYEMDVGDNGVPETRWVYAYDERCNRIRVEHDDDADTIPELFTESEYDESDRLVRSTETLAPDELREERTMSYDADGNLVLEEIDRPVDGSIDFWIEYDWLDGDLIEERWLNTSGIYWRTVTAYDTEGRVLVVEEHQYLCSGGTVFLGDEVGRRTDHTYDERGNQVLTVVDGSECEAADDVVDQRIARMFDEDDLMVIVNVDGDAFTHNSADGIPDACTYYTYDADGNVVREELDGVEWVPGSCDGIVDRFSVNVYRSDGSLVRTESNHGADGEPGVIVHHDYDDCGNLLESWEWRASEDGTTWRQIYGYGCFE
jgi:hypothetical protein